MSLSFWIFLLAAQAIWAASAIWTDPAEMMRLCKDEANQKACEAASDVEGRRSELTEAKRQFQKRQSDWRKFNGEFQVEALAPLAALPKGSENPAVRQALEKSAGSCRAALSYLRVALADQESDLGKARAEAARVRGYADYKAYVVDHFPKYPGAHGKNVFDANDPVDMGIKKATDGIVVSIKQVGKAMGEIANEREALVRQQEAELARMKADQACYQSAEAGLAQKTQQLGEPASDPAGLVAAGKKMITCSPATP